jgi:putative hydrolase of the HAD superfamily
VPPSPPSRPSRVETVLLDAGGVLLDLDYRFLARLLASHDCKTTVESLSHAESIARTEVQHRIRAGERPGELWEDYFHFILAHVRAPVDAHEPIIGTLWEAHHKHGLWTAAIPGAVDTVRALRARGLKVGVVSNAEGQVERDLNMAGFGGLLDTIVDSFRVGVEKPNPEIFRIALARLDAQAETCIYLGDVPAVDVDGARAAGIAAVLLDRHDLYTDSDAPRLRAIAELPGWLDS